MKHSVKKSVTVVFALFCVSTFGQKNKTAEYFEPYTESAEIEIVLKGAPEGKVQLLGTYGNQNLLEDSAIADTTGKVVFRNPKRYDAGLYYAFYNDNSLVTFLLDRNQKIFLHSDKEDLNKNMKTNSKENEIYYSNALYETDLGSRFAVVNSKLASAAPGSHEYSVYKEEQDKLVTEKENVVNGYLKNYPGSFFAAFKMMGQNPRQQEPRKPNGDLDTLAQTILYRNEFWNNFDFNDGRMLRTPVYYNKLNRYLTSLFYQQADSIMEGVKFILEKTNKGNKEIFSFTVNHLLLTYQEPPVMGGEKIFCYTVDNYFTKEKAYWTDTVNIYRARQQSAQMKGGLLGGVGQDLNCKNEKGEYVSLYSIKKPIRVVFLYNPDCEHCKKETPKLKALYDKWKSKGLEVYALNVEKDYDKWYNFIKNYGLDWVNVIDPNYESKYYMKYHISDTPGIYVLNSKNIIVAKQLLPDSMEPYFESIVK